MTLATLLRAQAAALRAQADVLDSIAEHKDTLSDELLDLGKIKARWGLGRDALMNAADRGEIELTRGPRRKLLVKRSALEAWIASKPYTPRKHVAYDEDGKTQEELMAEWERRVRRG